MPRSTAWLEVWLVDPVGRFDADIVAALADLRISVRHVRGLRDVAPAPLSPWGVIYASSLDRPFVAFVAGLLAGRGDAPRAFSWRLPSNDRAWLSGTIERLPFRAKPREIAALISFRVRHLARSRARRAAALSVPAGE